MVARGSKHLSSVRSDMSPHGPGIRMEPSTINISFLRDSGTLVALGITYVKPS